MSVLIRRGLWLLTFLLLAGVLTAPLNRLTAATAAAPNRAPAALPNPDILGMAIRDPWYDFGTFPGQPNLPNTVAQDTMGYNLSKLGVRWVRLEFHIEGTDALSVTQTARNDYFINTVAPRNNLKVLGLLSFGVMKDHSPCELLSTTTITNSVYGGGVNAYMQTWLDRSRMVASRYGDKVSAYEVLNEENRLPSTCHAGVEGDAIPATITARLHTKFYRFFKGQQAPPNELWRNTVSVILGGIHPAGTGTLGKAGYISDRQYLQQIYQSDGFQDFYKTFGTYPVDGLGYHPYPVEIRNSIQSDSDLINSRMNDVRTALAAVTPSPGSPLFWITEIGYNAAYGKQTRAGQADFLQQFYTAMSARGDVATAFWFKYEDFPPDTGPNAQQWGVMHINFTLGACPGGACYDPFGTALAEPAYFAYRELGGGLIYRSIMPIMQK